MKYTPQQDGLSDAELVESCGRYGFVATAAALRRSVKTVRRAFYRITEEARESGHPFDGARGHAVVASKAGA